MARTLASTLIVAALAGGCTTRQKVAGGGVGLAVVGLGLTFSTETRSEDQVGTKEKVGITLLLTGLVTLFVAAALEESEASAHPREVTISRTAPDAARAEPAEQAAAVRARQKREQAWALTKQAQEAARTDDCTKVTELSAQVGALDAEFFADVFMKDVAVQRCLTPKEPTPAPAPIPLPATPP